MNPAGFTFGTFLLCKMLKQTVKTAVRQDIAFLNNRLLFIFYNGYSAKKTVKNVIFEDNSYKFRQTFRKNK